jgi:hypothetical protein
MLHCYIIKKAYVNDLYFKCDDITKSICGDMEGSHVRYLII